MRKEDMKLCEQDKEFVKVVYHSTYTNGSMVMKKHFFDLKGKSIASLLRGCEWSVIQNYHPLLPELIDIDGEIQNLKRDIRRSQAYLTRYKDTMREDEIIELSAFIDSCNMRISEIVDRIVKERG